MTVKNLGLSSLAAITATLIAMPAAAQCVAVDPTVVPEIRLDPLDASSASQVVQPTTLRFRRTGIDTPALTVTYQIVDEDSPLQQRVGLNGGPQVEWRSTDSAREIGALRQEAIPLLRSGTVTFAAGETSKTEDIRLFLKNPQEDLPAGTYREQYTIRYWCGDPNTTSSNDLAGILAVVVRVPNVLSASVAGGSKRGEIDFMDFASLSRSLSVNVRSTGPYVVTARSLNDRALVREGAVSSSELDRIAYTMRFNGQSLGQGGGSTLAFPRAGLQGIQLPLDVTVEDVSKKRAGRYSDTVTLTLTPAS